MPKAKEEWELEEEKTLAPRLCSRELPSGEVTPTFVTGAGRVPLPMSARACCSCQGTLQSRVLAARPAADAQLCLLLGRNSRMKPEGRRKNLINQISREFLVTLPTAVAEPESLE